ncbi:hypothetical protein CHS0354_005685, partial [Potamilus streckersoni]
MTAERVVLLINLLGTVKSMLERQPLSRKIQEHQFRISQSATYTSMSLMQQSLPGPDLTDQPSQDPPQ